MQTDDELKTLMLKSVTMGIMALVSLTGRSFEQVVDILKKNAQEVGPDLDEAARFIGPKIIEDIRNGTVKVTRFDMEREPAIDPKLIN